MNIQIDATGLELKCVAIPSMMLSRIQTNLALMESTF